MSTINKETALSLMKMRLNRLAGDTSLDTLFNGYINAAEEQLESIGIHLEDSDGDMMLLVDLAVWRYQNRDKTGEMPEWLRLIRRERWLNQQRAAEVTDG